jgi:hypothetical protein
MIRSPEFLRRFARRIAWVEPGLLDIRNNALGIISIDLSRLLPHVMAGQWTVIHPSPGITS